MTPHAQWDALMAQVPGVTALPLRYDLSDRCVYDARGYLFAQIDDPQNAKYMVDAANMIPALAAEYRRMREEAPHVERLINAVRMVRDGERMAHYDQTLAAYEAVAALDALRGAKGEP